MNEGCELGTTCDTRILPEEGDPSAPGCVCFTASDHFRTANTAAELDAAITQCIEDCIFQAGCADVTICDLKESPLGLPATEACLLGIDINACTAIDECGRNPSSCGRDPAQGTCDTICP